MTHEEETQMAEADQVVASVLETDFSSLYGERAALRRRLLARHGDSRWSLTGAKDMTTFIRRIAMAAVALLLVGGLAFARFSPAMAESRQGVALWAAGGLPEGMHEVVFTVVGSAPVGMVFVNEDGTVTQVVFEEVETVEAAQAAATFTVKQPTALPAGYTLRSSAVSEDGNWVNLTYEAGMGEMVTLRQSTFTPPSGMGAGAGVGIGGEAGFSVHMESAEAIPAGTTIVNVEGGEMPFTGAIQLNIIHWEADGIYYELSGTLSETELQAIADSLQ